MKFIFDNIEYTGVSVSDWYKQINLSVDEKWRKFTPYKNIFLYEFVSRKNKLENKHTTYVASANIEKVLSEISDFGNSSTVANKIFKGKLRITKSKFFSHN